MKTINVVLDDDTAKELAKYPNMSATLREAFRLYDGHISTDTLAGMREAFRRLQTDMKEMEQRFIDQYELVEKLYNRVEELTN